MPLLIKGRPFFLSTGQETKLVSYIIEMQELGFGLTANEVRRFAYQLASETVEILSEMIMTGLVGIGGVCLRKGMAWVCVSLRICCTTGQLQQHDPMWMRFTMLWKRCSTTRLKDKPNRIWNLDESGFTMVTKPNKIVSPWGSVANYSREGWNCYCFNAFGHNIPPLFIFKGVRLTENIRENALPLSHIAVSKNSDIF